MLGLGTLTRVARELRQDLSAAQDRDPAARGIGRIEILLTYGGVQALLSHRVAHALHDAGVPLAPRLLANATRVGTGVEIHPAADIGQALFIDHGAGVVIGETAEIGDCVTLYQGVTLGGTGFARGKRHPTIEDEVVIYANATILGGKTVIGHHSVVGSSAWLTRSIAPYTTVTIENPRLRYRGASDPAPGADGLGGLDYQI